MRAAPAFQISLTRFGVWRAAVFALAGLGVATLAMWAIGRERATWIDGATVLSLLALILIARSVARVPAVDLRCDGACWSLAALGDPADAARSGELRVLVDLGPWMLLRFEPADGGPPVWLPVQRAGIAPRWHALRCAVHAARPGAATPSTVE